MSQFQISSAMNGLITAQAVDPTRKQAVLESIATVSEQARSLGIADHELMLAVAKKRDKYDPLCIITSILGQMMRFIGTWATAIIMIIGLALLLRMIVQRGAQLASFLGKVGGAIPFLSFAAGGLAGFAAGKLLDEDEDRAKQNAMNIAGSALESFFYGLMPGAVAGPVRSITDSFNSFLGAGVVRAVARAAVNNPVTRTVARVSGGPAGRALIGATGGSSSEGGDLGKVASGVRGIWNTITGRADGEPLTQEQIDTFSHIVDMSPEDVEDAVYDIAQAYSDGGSIR